MAYFEHDPFIAAQPAAALRNVRSGGRRGIQEILDDR